MAHYPLISIIIPCYNTADYLPETLNSLEAQEFQNFEIIAIDDGSTDNTLEILKTYALKNDKLTVLTQENTYCVKARINAIKHARGKYLVCLDSDDIISPTYLSECVQEAEKDLSLSIVYTDAVLFGSKNKPWKLPDFSLSSFLLTNYIYITALIRKSHYDDIGGFDEKMTLFEDWELFISLIKNGGKVKKISKPLFYYRQREDESSVTNMATQHKYSDNILKIYNKHYDFYKENKIFMHSFFMRAYSDLLNEQAYNERLKRKHSNIFVKYFYKFFRPKRYVIIQNKLKDIA
ncbi:glycosyltransferase [Eikenella longinqua]|uniref:glycosyltransferase n=1 Tax=Eikenella longinqua TaxID=1795827 RepID=UPI0009ED1767|nr:glycosyltransferase [Eikenella longinqua]